MRIYNTEHCHERIQRHTTYVQLFKLLKTHTNKVEINGIIETAITGRDYEFISLQINNSMEILDGIDPLDVKFEEFYNAGLNCERNKIRAKKIQEVREARWNVVDSKIFDNDVFSNLAAERNANLLYMSIERYKEGKYVNWMNLNGDYITITDDNIGTLKALYDSISDFTQHTFDAISIVITKIKNIETTNELMALDAEVEWNIAFNKVLANDTVGE